MLVRRGAGIIFCYKNVGWGGRDLQRNATRGLSSSTSSAARMNGITSGAKASGTRSPGSATPSRSLRDASVCASAFRLRLTTIDVEAVAVAVAIARNVMVGGTVGSYTIYTPLGEEAVEGCLRGWINGYSDSSRRRGSKEFCSRRQEEAFPATCLSLSLSIGLAFLCLAFSVFSSNKAVSSLKKMSPLLIIIEKIARYIAANSTV